MVNETWDRFGPAVRSKGADFLLLSSVKDYGIAHIMKSLGGIDYRLTS